MISTPGCGARLGPATPATAAAARTPTGTGATTGASRGPAPTPATVRDTFILVWVIFQIARFSETYRGSQAFSEPETRAVRDFIMARRSDIKLYLTFHRCVDSRYLHIWIWYLQYLHSPPPQLRPDVPLPLGLRPGGPQPGAGDGAARQGQHLDLLRPFTVYTLLYL